MSRIGNDKEWTPKLSQTYYYITGGHILKGVHKTMWTGSDIDLARQMNSNCFRSKKMADFIYKSFNGHY